jgi:hypothetical protein
MLSLVIAPKRLALLVAHLLHLIQNLPSEIPT